MTTTEMKHQEGKVAEAIEEQTAKLPSDTFLWSAMGAMGLSMVLNTMGRKEQANFVGQWVPTILIFGLYNKIVKVAGHDRMDSSAFGSDPSGSSYGSSYRKA